MSQIAQIAQYYTTIILLITLYVHNHDVTLLSQTWKPPPAVWLNTPIPADPPWLRCHSTHVYASCPYGRQVVRWNTPGLLNVHLEQRWQSLPHVVARPLTPLCAPCSADCSWCSCTQTPGIWTLRPPGTLAGMFIHTHTWTKRREDNQPQKRLKSSLYHSWHDDPSC